MYYKFREFKNYKYLLDIFINQRLYSSSFRKLNDNFEGQFYSNFFEDNQRLRLNPRKEEHISICSFSSNYKSHLMWSHYADGHRGIAIGFEIDSSKYKIEKVNYEGLIELNRPHQTFDELKSVFLNKLPDWSYEEEFRIISERQAYIEILIKEVIFGAETESVDKETLTKLIQLIDSKIKIDTYYG